MLMVDQRNHGASSALAFHPPHSVEASAGDLADLIDARLGGRVPEAMLGHSLGGKTVLEFLRRQAEQGRPLPKQVAPTYTHSRFCIPAGWALIRLIML